MTNYFGRLLDVLEFLDPLEVLALFESNNFWGFFFTLAPFIIILKYP